MVRIRLIMVAAPVLAIAACEFDDLEDASPKDAGAADGSATDAGDDAATSFEEAEDAGVPGLEAGSRPVSDAAPTGAADATAGGSWCAANGIGKISCWDFDVSGGLFNGWDETATFGGKLESTTDATSLPNALRSTLSLPNAAAGDIGSAWIRRKYGSSTAVLSLEFQIKRNACNQGNDNTGLSLAGLSIGPDTGDFWFVEVLAPPFTGLRFRRFVSGQEVAVTSSCSTPHFCPSSVPLPQGAWSTLKLTVTRSTSSFANITLTVDGKSAVTASNVATSPSAQCSPNVGQEKVGRTENCVAAYDNVTFDMR